MAAVNVYDGFKGPRRQARELGPRAWCNLRESALQ